MSYNQGRSPIQPSFETADVDAAAGTVDEMESIVHRIRQAWPDVKILVRGDSSFCRENIMTWCEDNDVDFLFGLAKSSRLGKEIEEEFALAKALYQCSGQASRVFKDFCYKTLDTWRWHRRVVDKAEHLAKGSNLRFVITSLKAEKQRCIVLEATWKFGSKISS